MKSICVFCGSNAGNQPIYRSEAEKLGRLLAARGIELVYGGGNVGLMGRWRMLAWRPEARSSVSFRKH